MRGVLCVTVQAPQEDMGCKNCKSVSTRNWEGDRQHFLPHRPKAKTVHLLNKETLFRARCPILELFVCSLLGCLLHSPSATSHPSQGSLWIPESSLMAMPPSVGSHMGPKRCCEINLRPECCSFPRSDLL